MIDRQLSLMKDDGGRPKQLTFLSDGFDLLSIGQPCLFEAEMPIKKLGF